MEHDLPFCKKGEKRRGERAVTLLVRWTGPGTPCTHVSLEKKKGGGQLLGSPHQEGKEEGFDSSGGGSAAKKKRITLRKKNMPLRLRESIRCLRKKAGWPRKRYPLQKKKGKDAVRGKGAATRHLCRVKKKGRSRHLSEQKREKKKKMGCTLSKNSEGTSMGSEGGRPRPRSQGKKRYCTCCVN